MAAYFGNGYLLNVLQRGSAPVGQLRPQLTPLARFDSIEATAALDASEVAREPTGQDPIHSLAERFERSGFSAGPNAVPPKESLTIGTVENISAATGSKSLPREKYLAEKNTTSPADPREATKPELRSEVSASGPSSPPSLPVPMQTSIASIAERPPQESAPLVETQPKSHSGSAVFELRMPEDFFRQPGPETGHAEEAETPVKRSDGSAHEQPTQSRHPVVRTTGSVDSAEEQQRAANDLRHVVTVKESIEPSDSQTFGLTPGKSIPESQAPPPITQNVVSPADIEAPAARVTLPSFQASASAPRLEPTPEHLQLWQPPVAPAVAASPRLRINRLEVQVINYTPPRVTPQTQAPDVSQLLERRHLGRIDLLI